MKKKNKKEEILLSERDKEIFFEGILNPKKPNQALIDAFKEHQAKLISEIMKEDERDGLYEEE